MSRIVSTLRSHALVGLFLLAVGFGSGWFSARLLPLGGDIAAAVGPGWGANEASPSALRTQFATFWEAWNLVENEFYHPEPLDRTRMIQGAIKGMLASLDDPYTVYQEPNLAALTSEHMQGTLEGIGVYLRITDGKAYIDRPIKNSPASKAGLVPNDEIVAIDGVEVAPQIANLDINEANVQVASKLRGPKGSSVTLLIARDTSSSFEVTVVRDEIVISSVSGELLGSIAYIKITDFKASTTEDFDMTLRELLPKSPSGLVLDLRNNPGGYLTNAQEVLGRLYDGVALYEQDRSGELKELHTIKGDDDVATFGLPIVVLVNGGSASASEIVAGALRDQRKGTYLLGEKTYGKGSVQNIHALSDSGSARITFAHWLTPNKTAIHQIGITPQFVVPYTEDTDNAVPCVVDRRPPEGQTTCADSQLSWALKILTTGELPPQVTTARK